MSFLLPALVALIPLLVMPGLLFHYDSLPKVALLALAMSLALLRPRSIARDVAELWKRKTGKWLCLLAIAQVTWSGVATSTSSRVLFSVLGSNWRRLGLITIVALAAFVVLAAAHLISKPRDVTTILRAMAVAAIGVSLFTIAQYFDIDPLQNTAGYLAKDGDFTIIRPPGTLGHADYLGWWLAIAVFCSWGLSRMENRFWRWLAVTATSLSVIATVLSGTRSAIAAIAGGLLSLAIMARARPRVKHWISAAALVGVFFLFFQSSAGERLRARVHWSNDEAPGGARPLLWRDAMKMVAVHPLTGFGPETFSAEFPKYQSVDLARLVPDFYHESPHNVAMDSLTSEGIPGLLVVIGWLALALYVISKVREKSSPVDHGLAAGFIASCIASLFNSMTIGPAVATLSVISLLLARHAERAGEDDMQGESTSDFPVPFTMAVAAPIAIVLAAFGVMLVVSDFKLQRFSRIAGTSDSKLAAAAYNDLRSSNVRVPAEDLYCSRRLASVCGDGRDAIARLQCSQVATQAAGRAIVTADNPPNAWYNLAMFAAAHNDARGTEKALRTAVELAPNWFRPHWALARFLNVSGRKSEAVTEVNRAALLSAGKNQEVADSLQTITQAR